MERGALIAGESRDITAGITTICEGFQATVARCPDGVALRLPAEGVEWTWAELAARVRRAAAVLHGLGLRRGDTVALLMRNRPEHFLADLAALHLGAAPFTIYATSAPAQVDYIIGDSGARILMTEPGFEAIVGAVEGRLEHVLTLSPGAPELDGDEPAGFDFEAAWRAVDGDDLVCIVYTSGTTGPPKGAEITNATMLANVRGSWLVMPIPEPLRHVSFLPIAHILERGLGWYAVVLLGGTATCCPDPAELGAALGETKPTYMIVPPRVLEKLKAKCEALGVDPAQFRVAAGLGELQVAGVGASPVPVPLIEWWQAAGLPLRQGWGMTELSALGTICSTDPADNGTCGYPIEGLELRVADDGEVLARGPMVIPRYRNLPEKTAELMDADGWVHTGDVGHLDEEGRLTLVDRKKELIISAGGKNMSPANIESELKSASPLIGQAVAIGNDRPFNVALIVLDPEVATTHPDDDARAAEVARGVAAANERLSRVEQIKRFTVLDVEWLPGGDELTPTMKLRRKPIDEKYAAEIEALYAG